MPVALTPSFSRACSTPICLADQREDKRLRHAHDREFIVGIAGGIDIAAGTDDTYAEQFARHAGQGWIDLRILALVVGLVPRMCASVTKAVTISGVGKLPVDMKDKSSSTGL